MVWFRDDYRLGDNPALAAAIETGAPVICLTILENAADGLRPMGAAARWWLHGSLKALDESLRKAGSRLLLLHGPALEAIEAVISATGASAIFWNRRYAAAEIALDSTIKKRLTDRGLSVQSFNGRLLNEPWQVLNQAGKPFQVFTPYLRAVLARPVEAPRPAPRTIPGTPWSKGMTALSVDLEGLGLRPTNPDWATEFGGTWQPGERNARQRLIDFLEGSLQGYALGRDAPARDATSRLSPHFRFGEISPRQVWRAVSHLVGERPELAPDAQKLLSEVVWRDFSYQLLHVYPHLPEKSHAPRFAKFPWDNDPKNLKAWQRGRTGYPIVDAGMRQLWRTGWMHNRVRMIVASFLVKHLLTDWRHGEAWFWDTLVDADPANNAFSWQWIAGSGPDSSPFHRIFNPVTQGEKFDPKGDYVRTFVPELAGVPANFIHKPWDAPASVLKDAGVELDKTYPGPIVPHGPARERALAAFRSLRDGEYGTELDR
nr:deoxyribodipyrimidine photo-lyase [Microvirga sp. ACRRW]